MTATNVASNRTIPPRKTMPMPMVKVASSTISKLHTPKATIARAESAIRPFAPVHRLFSVICC